MNKLKLSIAIAQRGASDSFADRKLAFQAAKESARGRSENPYRRVRLLSASRQLSRLKASKADAPRWLS